MILRGNRSSGNKGGKIVDYPTKRESVMQRSLWDFEMNPNAKGAVPPVLGKSVGSA
jgi:hypothetical protein